MMDEHGAVVELLDTIASAQYESAHAIVIEGDEEAGVVTQYSCTGNAIDDRDLVADLRGVKDKVVHQYLRGLCAELIAGGAAIDDARTVGRELALALTPSTTTDTAFALAAAIQ